MKARREEAEDDAAAAAADDDEEGHGREKEEEAEGDEVVEVLIVVVVATAAVVDPFPSSSSPSLFPESDATPGDSDGAKPLLDADIVPPFNKRGEARLARAAASTVEEASIVVGRRAGDGELAAVPQGRTLLDFARAPPQW